MKKQSLLIAMTSILVVSFIIGFSVGNINSKEEKEKEPTAFDLINRIHQINKSN